MKLFAGSIKQNISESNALLIINYISKAAMSIGYQGTLNLNGAHSYITESQSANINLVHLLSIISNSTNLNFQVLRASRANLQIQDKAFIGLYNRGVTALNFCQSSGSPTNIDNKKDIDNFKKLNCIISVSQKANIDNISDFIKFFVTKVYSRVFLASILVSLFSVATPLFVMNVYDRVIVNKAYYSLAVMSIGVITVLIFDGIIKYLRSMIIDINSRHIDSSIRRKVMERLLNSQGRANSITPFALSKQLDAYLNVKDFILSGVALSIIDSSFMFVIVAIMFYVSGYLGFIALASVFIIILFSFIAYKVCNGKELSYMKSKDDNSHLIFESSINKYSVKNFNLSKDILNNFLNSSYKASRDYFNLNKSKQKYKIALSLIQQGSYILLIIAGVISVGAGNITMGALIASGMLLNKILSSASQLGGIVMNLGSIIPSYIELKDLMYSTEKHRVYPYTPAKTKLYGDLSVSSINLNINKESLLKNISFHLEPNTKVAVIGNPGSGKSTLLQIIAGLAQPSTGIVTIDGVDINSIDPSYLRNSLLYVSSNLPLFSGTIMSNLKMGLSENITDQRIFKVSKLTGLHELVMKKSHLYQSMIISPNLNISQGECDLIHITKALIINPSILVLDSPFSNLSANYKQKVIDAINSVCLNKTTFISTSDINDLSSIDINCIIKIDKGQCAISKYHKKVNISKNIRTIG